MAKVTIPAGLIDLVPAPAEAQTAAQSVFRRMRDRKPASQTDCANCAARWVCSIGSQPQAAAAIGPALRERSFKSGDTLVRQGEMGQHVRIVKVGTVFYCRDDTNGQPRPVALYGRGAMPGLASFAGRKHVVTVVANTSGRYCEIHVEHLQSLAQNDPGFLTRLAQAHSDNAERMAQWAAVIAHRTVVSQVAASVLLLQEVEHSTRITIPSHAALASLLGTTRESVARALTVLENEGCLTRKPARHCDVAVEPLRAWLSTHA